MMNNCANSQCAKPLHYLREGRVFVFDVQDPSIKTSGKPGHHLEHFWLCGACSQQFRVEYEPGRGILVVPRRQAQMSVKEAKQQASVTRALAS